MQIIHSQSTSPAFNLAAEEFLFTNRQDDLLFLYVNESSVIIGSNQVIRNEVNLEFCKENNIQIVRRISGGGAVYHDLGNINFCFISNNIANQTTLSADFLLPVVNVLKVLNIPVEIGKRKDLWLPDGFKISGTASHISNNRVLHHGTLLFETNLDHLNKSLQSHDKDLSLKGTASVPSKVKNIRDYFLEKNQDLNRNDFKQNLIKQIEIYYNAQIQNLSYSTEIQFLVDSKYSKVDWNFKK